MFTKAQLAKATKLANKGRLPISGWLIQAIKNLNKEFMPALHSAPKVKRDKANKVRGIMK